VSVLTLDSASDQRLERLLSDEIDKRLDLLLAGVENPTDHYHAVTADPRKMGYLRFLLKHYSHDAHPWAACFHDNFKRFGPKTAGLCGVLKDTLRGTADWRGKGYPNHRDHGAPGVVIGEADKGAAPAWGGRRALSEGRPLSLLDELDLEFGVQDHCAQLEGVVEVCLAIQASCDVHRVLLGLEQPPVLSLAEFATKPAMGAVVLHARDTGRVMMVKRADDPKDPPGARGKWEFAGGHLRPSDGDDFKGAKREFHEETGASLPKDAQKGAEVLSPDGVHKSFVVHVAHEKDVTAKPDPKEVATVGWKSMDGLHADPSVRDKVRAAMPKIKAAVAKTPEIAVTA
jgi:8-oxo-dGTP pyrophosphatase MutT (NUDIX family)